MQKILFVLFSLLWCTSLAWNLQANLEEMRDLWETWKLSHGKTYEAGANEARFAIFMENYKYIENFNANNDSPTLAVNLFADLTPQEFKSKYTNCFYPEDDEEFYEENTIEIPEAELPTSVDWRTKGAVTPIKNQLECGGCWSFSTTGALEGLYFIEKGKLNSYSEQQLLDCDTTDNGCEGGNFLNSFKYTAKYGLQTESTYPYANKDSTCKYNKTKAIVVNKGLNAITAKSSVALKTALTSQPVSVAVDSDPTVFQFYSSGVISSNCAASLNHAILAVGYNTFNGTEAFIVKNQWGAAWGLKGYVYISTNGAANNGSGVCGILGQPAIPV